ncbi:Hypothetical predicted protein [Olea europaea subsp. europaea]|uniref:Uncharacterized protein n=1 Tax=Olea europaea subsp. europaea TaxID=158383 RepID=A0A8S0UQ48_OLEEU|nr:Hypothetical predicted protein [Olea europaea subsp. europaea]
MSEENDVPLDRVLMRLGARWHGDNKSRRKNAESACDAEALAARWTKKKFRIMIADPVTKAPPPLPPPPPPRRSDGHLPGSPNPILGRGGRCRPIRKYYRCKVLSAISLASLARLSTDVASLR